MVSKITLSLIQTVTVGAGGATSINFTSIPQTATDLYLTFSLRAADASSTTSVIVKFNASTSGYSQRRLSGNGSAASSISPGNGTYFILYMDASTATANTFGNASIYIPNYSGSSAKTASSDHVTENNATANGMAIDAMLWSGTAAITSIQFENAGVNMLEGSTVSLYTITKGSGGATVS